MFVCAGAQAHGVKTNNTTTSADGLHGCTAQAQKEVDTAKQLVVDEEATLAKTQTKLDSATTKLNQVADRVGKAEAAKAEESTVRAIARAICIVQMLIAMVWQRRRCPHRNFDQIMIMFP